MIRSHSNALVLLVLCGCGGPDPLAPRLHEPLPASSDDAVVAMVDSEPIYRSRVQQVCSSTGRPAREVVEGMVEMTLLAREAERRGLIEDVDVSRTYEKAMVQQLLEREVESKVDPDSVSMDEVRQFYVTNFRNKGVLLERSWRDIWMHIVAERRREIYEDLVARLREKTPVQINEQNVELYLGQSSG